MTADLGPRGAPSDAPARLTFAGGAGTVTGSRHLVEAGGHVVLLDCGLFQGLKELRLRNWAPPPFDPARLHAVVLSHAHLDHSGYLPVLARDGFGGAVHATAGTVDLLGILLPDSAHLQEEQAAHANRHGTSRHHPAAPLYTQKDAALVLGRLVPHGYAEAFEPAPGMRALYRRAGHILGAATVDLELGDAGRLVFSGDLGRWDRPILRDPELVTEADVLLLESTYGDREHPPTPEETLAREIERAAALRGTVLIPSFAVGRTQEIVYHLRRLEETQRIPQLPVHIDSPMAIDATEIYERHPEDHDVEMAALRDERRQPLRCHDYHLVRTVAESKALAELPGPRIIIAGSGMATGGRILHHLQRLLPDPHTTVLLVGFQAVGTRGRTLQSGAPFLRMMGRDVPVRAHVVTVDGLSAHADRREILRWLEGFRRPPRMTWIVHGEPGPAAALAETIKARFGWTVAPAVDGATVAL